jgi:hypothetical protein
VLHPAAGVTSAPIKAAATQVHAAAGFLADEYTDWITLVLGVKALLEQIQWDEECTDEAKAAWARLGRHLGFTCTRPEKLYCTGPDNFGALSAGRLAVTELKTGGTISVIAKRISSSSVAASAGTRSNRRA